MLMDPLLRAETKTNTSSEKVQAVHEKRKSRSDFEKYILNKPQREVNATEQKLLNNRYGQCCSSNPTISHALLQSQNVDKRKEGLQFTLRLDCAVGVVQ